VRWISLAALAAAGILLAVFWGDVPDRWVTHWGAHGQPDGWAMKNVADAAFPIVLGLGTWLLFEVMALLMARGGTSSGFPPEVMKVWATVVRAVGLAFALLFAALALALPLLQPRSALPVAIAFPLVIGVSAGGAMVWAWRETRRLRASGVAFPPGYTGIFYKNARDPRLWVPKVAGVGWTINFAHRLAWPMMLVLVGVPVAISLLVSFASGR